MKQKFPPLPPLAPFVDRPVLRMVGKTLGALTPWSIQGTLPNIPKLVMLAAPHSSNWDGVFGILGACAFGLRCNWLGKHSLFSGVTGSLMRKFGGIPVDRNDPKGAVGQVAQAFAERERLWLVLAPEGTRKKVKKWRTGFWHIARAAQVPLLPVYFHYPEQHVGIGEPFMASEDLNADLERLYHFYAPYRGKGGKIALPEGMDPSPYLR
jgi:1-acyl-sn-glycerol-3-phosphate acyltransferase